MHPGGHDGLSKMPHGDFSRVLWVKMAQNISRITFAGGFLFKHISSDEMQWGKANHILLGSPIKTSLSLTYSVYHPNFPVSLSFPAEGTPSMNPAAALGMADNRARDSSTYSELPVQQCPVPDSAPAGASRKWGCSRTRLLPNPEPTPRAVHKGEPCCGWQGFGSARSMLSPQTPQQSMAGHSGMALQGAGG